MTVGDLERIGIAGHPVSPSPSAERDALWSGRTYTIFLWLACAALRTAHCIASDRESAEWISVGTIKRFTHRLYVDPESMPELRCLLRVFPRLLLLG